MRLSRFTLVALALATLFFLCPTVQAKDQWIQIRSKNFYLVGNASEKEIRKVGTRLEQFRETFRLLFANTNLSSPVPTNVIVFKSESSYRQFKPKRSDGKIDEFVAGYFQPGEDVNYITLSTEGEDADTFDTIFHEYVHSIVNTNFGKSEVPTWFNEGLAEYYSTFAIEDDQKVKLGLAHASHMRLLRETKLMPLQTLFSITNRQLSDSGSHSRTIFYAESWALIHYLIQSGKGEVMSKFLKLLMDGTPPEKAFQDTFQSTYAQMESELKKYVAKDTYQYHQIAFKAKLLFDADMQASPLDEASSNTYLGDLLFHTQREDDAEPFLLAALKLQPDSSMANTTLGMVKLKQRKFEDAKRYLETAIRDDQKNPMAFYRYAYLLSREGRDEFGYVKAFPPDTAEKMRIALRKAIALKPEFTESYELLAFVDVVNNEQLDDAASVMLKALRYQPGNQRYSMRVAEIYARQNKFTQASSIVEKIARTTDEPELRQRAETLVQNLRQRQEFEDRIAAEQKRYQDARGGNGNGTGFGPPAMRRPDKPMSEAEVAKAQAELNLRSVNEAIRRLRSGEDHVIGHIQKIDCRVRPMAFTVKTAADTFVLTSRDFEGLSLNVFIEGASQLQVGCGTDLSAYNAVLSFRPSVTPAKGTSRGELVGADFVANDFRLMTSEELAAPAPVIFVAGDNIAPRVSETNAPPPPRPAAEDLDKRRRDAMMQALKDNVRTAAEGEKRELGYLDRIDCTNKNSYFILKTANQTLRLLSSPENQPSIRLFVQDMDGVRFGCAVRPIEFPAVIVYKDKPDAKAKSAGVLVSLDFVPKTFVLE